MRLDILQQHDDNEIQADDKVTGLPKDRVKGTKEKGIRSYS